MKDDFRLGDWLVQPAQCRLSSDDRTIQVRAKVMDLLTYLSERPGEVVSKEQLLDHVWGSTAVSESALTRTVAELRQALGDDADDPRLLETIQKRGYRLIGAIAPVERATGHAAAPARRSRRTAGLTLMFGAAALLIGVALWARFGSISRQPVRMAVLPFEYLGDDRDREYLADGLAEDTTVSLGIIDPEHLVVVGRTSTLRYKGTRKSLTEIGHELSVDYLVESTVRKEGSRLRLTSKLIRVSDQALVWSKSYERELTSILGLQLEVSTAVAEQIQVHISAGTRASIERRHSRNADAYDLYMRGRALWIQRRAATTQRAIEYYKRAIAIDQDYGLAWSGLADAYSVGPITADVDPGVVRPLARYAVSEALRTASDLVEVQTSDGILNFWLEWNWPAAEAALRRAETLNGGYALAHHALGNVLSHSGRHSEAQEEIRRARELDSQDPMLHAISSQFAFHAGDYTSAALHARKALLLDPDFWIGDMQLGQALERTSEKEAAINSLHEAARLSGGNSKPVSTAGYILGATGRPSEARAVLEQLVNRSRDRYVPPYAVALIHAGLGDRESMFKSLDEAYVAHDVHLVFLPVDPKWDSYRTDPRFAALLDKCGFMRRRN